MLKLTASAACTPSSSTCAGSQPPRAWGHSATFRMDRALLLRLSNLGKERPNKAVRRRVKGDQHEEGRRANPYISLFTFTHTGNTTA